MLIYKSMARGGKREGAGRPKARPGEKYQVKAFTLTPKTVRLLNARAKKDGRPMSHLVEAALKAYLDSA